MTTAIIICVIVVGIAVIAYNFGQTNKKIEGVVATIDRSFRASAERLQGDYETLEAQSCNRNCGQRRTVSQDQRHKLKEIANKNQLSNAKEMPCRKCSKENTCELPEIPVRIGCYMFDAKEKEPCSHCQTAEDEQTDTEAREGVEEHVGGFTKNCHKCKAIEPPGVCILERYVNLNDPPCTQYQPVDNIEAVAEANKEAAESSEPPAFVRCHRCRKDTKGKNIIRDGKPFCSEQCRSEDMMSEPGDQEKNIETAAAKINAATKNALKASVKDNNSLPEGGDIDEIEETT
jgi:endogenous inhibitor of DNA gyrase (YacG/DUF329 family)